MMEGGGGGGGCTPSREVPIVCMMGGGGCTPSREVPIVCMMEGGGCTPSREVPIVCMMEGGGGVYPLTRSNCFYFFSSEVWLGEYQGQKVAIKMLKDLKKDDKASQQFLTEASIMT